MADGTQANFVAPLDTIDGGAVVFAMAGGRYALPLASVEAIMTPPVLCRVPHAPEALLGAGNLGGQVLPVVELWSAGCATGEEAYTLAILALLALRDAGSAQETGDQGIVCRAPWQVDVLGTDISRVVLTRAEAATLARSILSVSSFSA